MRLLILLALISLGLVAVQSSKLLFKSLSHLNNKENSEVAHWVVLVAGSNGWYNYRHQADVSHAYQIVRKHGIPKERIITMMYDDVAHDKERNPLGILINQPGGPDVYDGVVVDYRQGDVNAENFLAVLRGDENALKGKGSGKVVKSGPNDHIFVNFVDHGGPGVLCFPNDVLHADDFVKTLKEMHNSQQYGQMVLYIEACYSGSMFDNILPNDINVYALTAANSQESSYACYLDAEKGTYLGDMFSVAWMEDSDVEHFNLETLNKQYLITRVDTSESHVSQFGDKEITKETLENFQGEENVVVEKSTRRIKNRKCFGAAAEDVPLAILYNQLDLATDEEEIEDIKAKIKHLIWERDLVEKTSKEIVQKVSAITNNYFEDLYSNHHKLTNHHCYKEAVKVYREQCFEITQNGYALSSISKLMNMCESNISLDVIVDVIKSICN